VAGSEDGSFIVVAVVVADVSRLLSVGEAFNDEHRLLAEEDEGEVAAELDV
jgi:hypothetical protein